MTGWAAKIRETKFMVLKSQQVGLASETGTETQRGYCIRSPLVTKLFEVVLVNEDVTRPELKNSSPWCTCDLSLNQVSAM